MVVVFCFLVVVGCFCWLIFLAVWFGFLVWFGLLLFVCFPQNPQKVQLPTGARWDEETLSFFVLTPIKTIPKDPDISCECLTTSHVSARTKKPRL